MTIVKEQYNQLHYLTRKMKTKLNRILNNYLTILHSTTTFPIKLLYTFTNHTILYPC
jgi:hypothetical protein